MNKNLAYDQKRDINILKHTYKVRSYYTVKFCYTILSSLVDQLYNSREQISVYFNTSVASSIFPCKIILVEKRLRKNTAFKVCKT